LASSSYDCRVWLIKKLGFNRSDLRISAATLCGIKSKFIDVAFV
jgi:hypothetical protein